MADDDLAELTTLAARAHSRLEPLHAFIYFAPELQEELAVLGLKPGRMVYFAGRSAPMGAVGPGTVAATFYNFSPSLIGHLMPRVWTLTTPEQVIEGRLVAVDRGLQRLLGELADADVVAETAELVREATTACEVAGRPLYAAHADLDWPQSPLLQLWHGITLLREYRGDGHIAALVASGLTGIEALVTHTATGFGFTEEAAKATRGWSDEEWSNCVADLQAAGLLTADGSLTEAGGLLRLEIEAKTNELDLAPWEQLGPERTLHLINAVKPLQRQLLGAGAFAPGVFSRG
ncbi:hypothetical protein SAMN05892883_3882 [Jatrophihabitans sp. GAS493]|uniref:SCO6745 family protein n=1 Tax=Jatrophihabitans sp. GAS493 TaxID=1907575 RepID=UPI000BB8B109|nr:hypothetical protein [Jatrophihabitans sp. GAS493]SOD74692.1 hypothetical protein SAMN05892883_3882 [Jatrophihabitans sp. GAS493]